MKTKKLMGVVLTGGFLMAWGTSCLPNNFWANAFDNAASTAITSAVDDLVIDVLNPNGPQDTD